MIHNKPNKIPARLQWFLDRIGKTVYRNKNSCDCKTCEDVYVNGLLIKDELQANYVWDMEGLSNYEDFPLRYFDTVEERDNFEKEL